jgi:hypothetical protein
MASRTEKLRRRQHRKDKKRKAKSFGLEVARSEEMLVNPRGAAKMSEALMDLVEPEWGGCADDDSMRKLLFLGMIAWNAALMQGAERAAFLEKMAQGFPSDLREDFKRLVEPFILRKQRLFPYNQRPILSFDLSWLASGEPYLSVISGLS